MDDVGDTGLDGETSLPFFFGGPSLIVAENRVFTSTIATV